MTEAKPESGPEKPKTETLRAWVGTCAQVISAVAQLIRFFSGGC